VALRLQIVIAKTVTTGIYLLDEIGYSCGGNYEERYYKVGINQAVIDALKEGGDPDSIVQRGLVFEGLNPQNLVMALYCAGVKGKDIRDAADHHGISEMIVTAGYKKSVVECGDAVAESQAYTPILTGFSRRTSCCGQTSTPTNLTQ